MRSLVASSPLCDSMLVEIKCRVAGLTFIVRVQQLGHGHLNARGTNAYPQKRCNHLNGQYTRV
jgi:hypothetical protein